MKTANVSTSSKSCARPRRTGSWIDASASKPRRAERSNGAKEARRKARRAAQREGYTVSKATLQCADWVILVTSLSADDYPFDDILSLYRLRWRIELAFKRLKSVVGLSPPPGFHENSAKSWILAHLLMILLLEPLVDELEDSPHWALAA